MLISPNNEVVMLSKHDSAPSRSNELQPATPAAVDVLCVYIAPAYGTGVRIGIGLLIWERKANVISC